MSEFHRLIEREIPRLRRYARALTRSADRADDLVQETLMRAIAKGHLWQEGTDIRAWLFTIMHNQYVNMVRRAMRDGANVDIEQISCASGYHRSDSLSSAPRTGASTLPPSRRASRGDLARRARRHVL